MKTIILAGGFGSRLDSITKIIPKPLVKVGKHPILLHILKIYLHYGYSDFILALGYKGDKIKKRL
jgi:glucose-1-phosphate cytidylyltransferase